MTSKGTPLDQVGETSLTGDPFISGEDALDAFLVSDDKSPEFDRTDLNGVNLRKYVTLVSGTQVGVTVHQDFKAPVLLVSRRMTTGGMPKYAVLRNPCLKDLDFVRVMDPFTAYQEIAMFLGGVMAEQDKAPLRTGSDEVIAQQKGFDEWSFRTSSPGQKKTNRKVNRERKKGNS